MGGQKEERARAALARMSGDINRFVGICLQAWGALCGDKKRKQERTKAVLARIVAEGEKLFGMCYREWGKYAEQIRRRKKAREERVKALMGRLAMQSQSTMVMCIREWIQMYEEAYRAKQAAKGGKEEKKRAAIAKFAANGERFQAMVLQAWREVVASKKAREQKKGERVQDLMKRMAMEADNLMIFAVREWVSFTDEERRAKFSRKAGKEEKKAAAMARIAGNGERFQAMVLQGWHQRAAQVQGKKKEKDKRVKDLLQRINMEAEGLVIFVMRE